MRIRMIMQCEESELLDPLMQTLEWLLIRRFNIVSIRRNLTGQLNPDPTLEHGLYYEVEVVNIAQLPPLMEKALSMRPPIAAEKIEQIFQKEKVMLGLESRQSLPAPHRVK